MGPGTREPGSHERTDPQAGPDTEQPASDVPEAATRRLTSGSFSSGLTVPDFAACLEAGLQPVGLVQGFCAMQWGWYGAGSQMSRLAGPYASGQVGLYSRTWQCPHGFVSAEHRAWGQNFEQPWVETAWAQGFSSAYARLVEEAQDAGAHGVIGVVDRATHLADTGVTEFHIVGTAVVVEGGRVPPGSTPWTTYLAGQRLTKLVEAGFMPVSVAAALSSVRVWGSCVTEYLMSGTAATWGGGYGPQEVTQVSEAHAAARRIARERVRQQTASDSLHGARLVANVRELSEGDQVVECALRGTRVRRTHPRVDPPAPRPTVRLG